MQNMLYSPKNLAVDIQTETHQQMEYIESNLFIRRRRRGNTNTVTSVLHTSKVLCNALLLLFKAPMPSPVATSPCECCCLTLCCYTPTITGQYTASSISSPASLHLITLPTAFVCIHNHHHEYLLTITHISISQ